MSSNPSSAMTFALVLVLLLVQKGACLEDLADVSTVYNNNNRSSDRNSKFLSVFSVVRFPNMPCRGSDTFNGTCYTVEECKTRGGVGSVSCAEGFGICCLFSLTCGQTSAENNTYFQSTGQESGSCSIQICRCNSNICQLRLDFSNFVIAGPSTLTVSSGKALGGTILPGGENTVATATQCSTDSFSVTGGNGNGPPVICGVNTGEHMYVDASAACNNLNFQLGQTPVGINALPSRRWSIRVTQYACNYDNLAPAGCTQYFFGPSRTTGIVKTFNFDGGVHLADQNQEICVRRESGQCSICWAATAPTDFVVSGKTDAMSLYTKGSLCCNYGSDGKGTKGYDCITIPGAAKNTAKAAALLGDRFCGRSKGLGTVTKAAVEATICSSRIPFSVRFMSDHYEFTGKMAEATNPGKGARLMYTMKAC